MTRSLPALNLTKSPLVLVLCQVRFATIFAMEKYFPMIQDALRLRGYPLAKNTVIQEAIFTPAGTKTIETQRWEVENKQKTRSIVLSGNFVVFQTTAYSRFDDFVREVDLAVSTVASQVKGLLIQRVGLRYVDLVRETTPGHTWKDYIQAGLHGIRSERFIEDSQNQLYQSVANTRGGTMIVRLFQNRKGQTLPPDLAGSHDLKPSLNPPLKPNELLTILDLDHFSTHEEDYREGCVSDSAWKLHDDLDQVFRNSLVTSKALEVWK